MVLSEQELLKGVIAVYNWQYEPLGSFDEMLVTLYKKSDGVNRDKIKSQWAYITVAVDIWERAGDNGNDLFRAFGVGRFKDEMRNA